MLNVKLLWWLIPLILHHRQPCHIISDRYTQITNAPSTDIVVTAFPLPWSPPTMPPCGCSALMTKDPTEASMPLSALLMKVGQSLAAGVKNQHVFSVGLSIIMP